MTKMDDKTMLELAARAAGIDGRWIDEYREYDYQHEEAGELQSGIMVGGSRGNFWNPLTDDGDALRLAVKLRLVVDASDYPSIDVQYKHSGKYWILTEDSGDASVDARRAIVRAAAEIGKGMGVGE